MLSLKRKKGESITIAENGKVLCVIHIKDARGPCQLRFEAPSSVRITRTELERQTSKVS